VGFQRPFCSGGVPLCRGDYSAVSRYDHAAETDDRARVSAEHVACMHWSRIAALVLHGGFNKLIAPPCALPMPQIFIYGGRTSAASDGILGGFVGGVNGHPPTRPRHARGC
jgi:hypothetical protein